MVNQMPFPTTDVLIVSTNWNIIAASQTTTEYHLFMQFHDDAIDCKFIFSFRPTIKF